MRADRDDSGLSLLELVVVCSLLTITLAGAWTILNAVSLMSNRMSARANATDESQTFVDEVENELLQANSLKSIAATSTTDAAAQSAFYDVGPRQLGFYADLLHNGRPQRIAYFVSGTTLMRQQATAKGTVYPYSWAASSTPVPVVQTIDPSWGGAVFTFYGAGDWPPPQITAASQAASITVVTVQMKNMATWADQTISYAASSTVRVRSVANSF